MEEKINTLKSNLGGKVGSLQKSIDSLKSNKNTFKNDTE